MTEPQLSAPRARGLTLMSIVAVGLAPFAIPTFGVGIALGVFLIVTALILQHRGYRARGPLVAGIFAVVIGGVSAGACGFFVLRTAEVSGKEERRQDRIEDRFDKAFEKSEQAPQKDSSPEADGGTLTVDAGTPLDADSPAPRVEDG